MTHPTSPTGGPKAASPATSSAGLASVFQRPTLVLLITGAFSALAMASAPSALAQMTPALDRSTAPAVLNEPGCMQGFKFQQTGNTYSCTSAPIKCTKPFTIPEAKVVDNRFVYTCTRIQ